ncbi:MAG: Hpt domain-containing protein, partial [Arenimonas sp.]|nr:Hpt domain-containing protein [Arenimonas sp.]
MKLTSPIDVTVLTWLKPELDSTLHQARNSLEQYVEEGRGVTSLRECIVHLHQVAGILNIVELAGASKLAEEMEKLAYGLAEGEVQSSDNAFSFLMQCIVQLPDYLERLQNGHKDVPIILLPLINELRSLRNESELGEESVYGAATQLSIPEQAFNLSSSANSNLDFSELALQFQAGLLAWFNNQEDLQAAKNLAVCCSQIGSKNQDDSSRKVFWVASVLLQAVANGQLKLSNALRNSIVKIDKEVDYINNRIVGEVRKSSPARLTQELLYFVAQNYKSSDDLRQVYEVFELEHNIPNASEIEHARSSLLGRNNALLQSVSAVIKEDILRVKDALDMSIRNADAAPKDFVELVNLLNRIENTLGLINANEAKDLINSNKEIIKNSIDNATVLTESELMGIAKSLLSVEFLLDHHGANTSGNNAEKLKSDFLTSSQSNQLLDVLIRESIVNFTEVQAAFVAFVENHWDHSQLASVPALFKQVSGALDLLEFSQVSNFINALSSFTRYEFIENQKIPTSENMERLAEVLASLEYYLESVRDRRPNRARILDITQKNLEALNYWPIPDYATSSAVFGKASDVAIPAPPQAIANESVEIAPPQDAFETSHKAVSADETPVDNASKVEQGQIIIGFDLNAEGIDDEIREIFLEEFAEESENLNVFFNEWKSDFENIELLRPIRRVFHTFKGSGKLVGAKDLSEYSWKIESLLNRVLEGSRPPSEEVVSIIAKTIEILPNFNEALLGGTVILDIAGLSNVVDRLAAGEELTYQAPKSVSSTPITEAKVLREPIIDPVLFEILKPEVSGHLETVKAWLESAQSSQNPIFEDSVFRAIHTMNGAFAMSEVPSMTELLAPTEALLRRSIANKNPAKSDTLSFIGQVVNAVQQTLNALTENSAPDHYQDLTKRAFELRDELPERLEVDRLEAERLAAEQLEVVRLEAERVEAERAAAEQLEIARVEAERVEADRVAAEQLELVRLEAERVEAERVEAERVEAERAAAEQLEVARLEADRIEAERVAAEQLEVARHEAER